LKPQTDYIKVAILVATSLLVVFLVIYPLVALFIGSLGSTREESGVPAGPWQGYILVLHNLDLLFNSFVVATGATVLAVVFGVALAWITTRTNTPFTGILEQLILIPFYLTPLLGAVGWSLLAVPGESGILNRLAIALFGGTDGPFDVFTPTGIVWVLSLYFTPFPYLFAAGALRSMEPALEESAQVLGASKLRTALSVTLPLIKPAILGSTLLVFVLALGNFGVPAVLGMPNGYFVLTTKIYELVSGFNPNYSTASAMGLSLFVFTAFGVWLQFKVLGQRRYTTVSGRGFRPRVINVKVWRWPLFAAGMLYVLVAVFLPVGSMVWASFLKWMTTDPSVAQFTLANYVYVLWEYPTTQRAIINSLILALGGSCVTMVICVIISWILVRTSIRYRSVLEYLAMLPLSVPAIVFSVGLLWAWIRFPFLPVYGTLWILLIAYISIFLPYGVRAINATLVQIDKSLEECASVFGASWGHIMKTITFPLLTPGLWAGWTILFVSIVKELTASALLYNSKTVVMSVAVFDLWMGSTYPRVAALSLVQAVIVFLVLMFARKVGGASGVAIR